DRLALAVEHVVVLEHVLANLGVAALDLRLCAANRARDGLRLDREVVGAAAHERLSGTRVEQAHEVVLQREVEAALARVALTAGATAQLVVDAARLVALGAEHVEATDLAHLLGLDLDLGA